MPANPGLKGPRGLSLRDLDPTDPAWKSVELIQRGRMILDVCTADLRASEDRLGAFHATTWHFRNALADAHRAWDRLRAEFGGRALEAALAEPPLAALTVPLSDPPAILTFLAIGGQTYRAERIAATDLALALWRLTRLLGHDDGPYYLGRLRDGSTYCDCAEWTYHRDDTGLPPSCKHLVALDSMGWL